ncbi:MAG: hypothetical protein LUG13_06665 [Oscillospiraceae bacterium]|nr:hypothetical protein [Oscillospiraceae bacterium]
MSQPTFPTISPELTREEALNMILASIAMEELGLSHIINAEGEKLQYVLGTLGPNGNMKPTTDEVLAVNKSITCLLERVTDNQILLKNKMEKALKAQSDCTGGTGPTGPTGATGATGATGSTVCVCPSKCSASFHVPKRGTVWHVNHYLPWSCRSEHQECFKLCPPEHKKIGLPPGKRFLISFTANVSAMKPQSKCDIIINLQMRNADKRSTLFTYHGPTAKADKIITVSIGGIIVTTPEDCECSEIMLKLLSPNALVVKDASLWIIEI